MCTHRKVNRISLECQCISMDAPGNPWMPMGIHGYPWLSLDIHEYPQISMASALQNLSQGWAIRWTSGASWNLDLRICWKHLNRVLGSNGQTGFSKTCMCLIPGNWYRNLSYQRGPYSTLRADTCWMFLAVTSRLFSCQKDILQIL